MWLSWCKGSVVLFLGFFLSPLAAIASSGNPALEVVTSHTSPALSVWQQGQMRLWLQQNSLICLYGEDLDSVRGEIDLTLAVEPGNSRVQVDGQRVTPQALAHCLARNLPTLAFDRVAPRFLWQGQLRFQAAPKFLVVIRSWSGQVSHRQLENTILAALEQPSACLDRFFSLEPPLGMVLDASLIASTPGQPSQVTVAPRTGGPDEVGPCLEQHLAAIIPPPGQLPRAELMIYLLRVVPHSPDGSTIELRESPAIQ